MQKVATLRRLWTEECLRESRARIRNQELLQSFLALEAQLEDLSARTSALRRRKREYEEFLQHLKIDLQKRQGSDERQAWVPKTPLERLMGPLSTNWNAHHFQTGDQRESLLLPSKGTMPSWATPGIFQSGFGEHKQSWGPSTVPPFHAKNTGSRTVRKHDNRDVSSLWSPCFPSGQGSESSVVRRCHPKGWQRSGVGGRPEDLLSKNFMDINIMNSEELRGAARRSVHNSRCAEEEPDKTLVRRRKGHSLPNNNVEGVSQSAKVHGEVPAEIDSEQEGAGRESKSSPRQQEMRSKQQDANSISILSEELRRVPLNRSPGLRKHKKNITDQGETEKIWEQQEGALSREEQGDGDLRVNQGEEKAKSNENQNVEDAGSFGQEQTSEENEALGNEMEEAGSIERGLSLLTEGPEQGEQEENMATDETMTREGNILEGLGRPGVEENGSPCTEPEIRMGNNLERERVQNVEGDAGSEEDEGGTTSKRDDGPSEAEGAQNGSFGKETGPEQNLGGQKRDHGQEEDAASTSSGSVQIPLETMKLGTAEQHNGASRRTPGVQNESPTEAKLARTGTESACEGEEEEEKEESEETEADTDIEAALAPYSYKSGSKHRQGETTVRRLQDLWTDVEEAKDGNPDNKDDFYD